MGIKFCKCKHRKESHKLHASLREDCEKCDCKKYDVDLEFIFRSVTGAFASDVIINHLHDCGIRDRIACLYVVHVPSTNTVRIGRSMDLMYRWATRMAEWPSLIPVRLICAIPDSMDLEKAVHERFKKLRLYSEWFRYDVVFERLVGIDRTDMERIIAEKE